MPTVKKDLAVKKKDLAGKKRLGEFCSGRNRLKKRLQPVSKKVLAVNRKRPRETTGKRKTQPLTKDPTGSSPPNRQEKILIQTIAYLTLEPSSCITLLINPITQVPITHLQFPIALTLLNCFVFFTKANYTCTYTLDRC